MSDVNPVPSWALEFGMWKGKFWCWSCNSGHRKKLEYKIDYCEDTKLLKVGRFPITAPSPNMTKYLLSKPKAEWPPAVKICGTGYYELKKKSRATADAPAAQLLAESTLNPLAEGASECSHAPQQEAEKAHLPPAIDADEDIELAQGALLERLLIQLRLEGCSTADLMRFNVIVVKNLKPCEMKVRPSERDIAGYQLISLPAAVFEKHGGKYFLRFVGVDDLCSKDFAETLGRCFEKLSAMGTKVSAPSRQHVPEQAYRSGPGVDGAVHFHGEDMYKVEEEVVVTSGKPRMQPPRKSCIAPGVEKKATKEPAQKAAKMSILGLRRSRNVQNIHSGNDYGLTTRKNVPMYSLCAVCDAAVRRVKTHVLWAKFTPAIATMQSIVHDKPTVTLGGCPFTAVSVTTHGWGNTNHRDKRDEGKFSFLVWFGIGDLKKVEGGTFLFPSWGLKMQPGYCTAIYLATGLVPHCTTPSSAGEDGRYVGIAMYANELAVNLGRDFIAQNPSSPAEACRKRGLVMTEGDIDENMRGVPEFVAMLNMPQ